MWGVLTLSSKRHPTPHLASQVDCPGHASLIRTIIGGAQIMDMMLLVVDATKGMQAQTTECVVIGEAVMASGADVIVVLNKVCAGHQCSGHFLFTRVDRILLAVLRKTKDSISSPRTCDELTTRDLLRHIARTS